jgi:hypothetical protein
MALKKSYISRWGGIHANAYHKINGIHWAPLHHNSGSLGLQVYSYDTKEARTAGSQSLDIVSYMFPLTGSVNESWVSQSYAHLKTHPDFSGSIDI